MQQALGILLLVMGIVFGVLILRNGIKDRESLRSEAGSWPLLGALETGVYFLATMGISDYVLNTLILKHLRLAEDKRIPPSLVACALTPGAVIAFFLLNAQSNINNLLLVGCGVATVVGSVIGSGVVLAMDGKKIKKIMAAALAVTLAVLIFRSITSGREGVATLVAGSEELSLWRTGIAILVAFLWGFFNMFGVPMKATGMSAFLLLGISPLQALTLTLCVGGIAPMGGGFKVIGSGEYQKKLATCAVIFGSIGAVAGGIVAISLPALLLNVILMVVIGITIFTLVRG